VAIGDMLRAWGAQRPTRSTAFWLLAVLVVSSFLLGGGSREDVLSLLLLRPLTAILLVAALASGWTLAWQRGRAVLIIALLAVAAVALQLVPLPPGIWTSLGGREPIIAAYGAADMALPWLPLSVTPAMTWNALFALMTPLAALILALAIDEEERLPIFRLLLALGLLSALLGVLQSIGAPHGPLYFYRITNNGLGVGLFANRNHQAVLITLLLPMLAAHAAWLIGSTRRPSRLILPMTLVLCGALIPLLLVTGSRLGLGLGVLAIIAAGLILWRGTRSASPAPAGSMKRPLFLGLVAVVMLGGLIALTLSRATAVQRLATADAAEDMRIAALPTIWRAISDFFPWGSGYGSFADVYRIYEPSTMLSSSYFNHAHNDFVELVLTGGVPGVFVLIVALLWLLVTAFRAIRLDRKASPRRWAGAMMALCVILLLVLASIADYPLRTPSLSLLLAIMVALLARAVTDKMTARQSPTIATVESPDLGMGLARR
jgi:O-antigen ligase